LLAAIKLTIFKFGEKFASHRWRIFVVLVQILDA